MSIPLWGRLSAPAEAVQSQVLLRQSDSLDYSETCTLPGLLGRRDFHPRRNSCCRSFVRIPRGSDPPLQFRKFAPQSLRSVNLVRGPDDRS
uniref:Uncharacterized protein n=1 Tax=Sphaerodactylus townsendi TaxID=933632 RepID=A0ACB8GCC7_9SAUR